MQVIYINHYIVFIVFLVIICFKSRAYVQVPFVYTTYCIDHMVRPLAGIHMFCPCIFIGQFKSEMSEGIDCMPGVCKLKGSIKRNIIVIIIVKEGKEMSFRIIM